MDFKESSCPENMNCCCYMLVLRVRWIHVKRTCQQKHPFWCHNISSGGVAEVESKMSTCLTCCKWPWYVKKLKTGWFTTALKFYKFQHVHEWMSSRGEISKWWFNQNNRIRILTMSTIVVSSMKWKMHIAHKVTSLDRLFWPTNNPIRKLIRNLNFIIIKFYNINIIIYFIYIF